MQMRHIDSQIADNVHKLGTRLDLHYSGAARVLELRHGHIYNINSR